MKNRPMRAPLRRLALVGLCICFAPGVSVFRSSPQQTHPLRTLVVTVTDKKGAPLNSLTASSFTIANKSVIEEIIASTQPDITVSVAIVFDLSGSMGNDRDNKASKRTQSALAALARFVQKSNPANEYFLIGFNDKIHLIRTKFQDATETIADINSMASLSFINGAALYDALQVAIKKLSPSNFSKQAIILVTDSYDDSSKGTFKDTVRLLEQANTLVY